MQHQLFPLLESELKPLSALDQQFCKIISLTDLGRFTRRYEGCGIGSEHLEVYLNEFTFRELQRLGPDTGMGSPVEGVEFVFIKYLTKVDRPGATLSQ